MAKIILNKDFGGFSASYKAHKLYAKKKFNVDNIYVYNFEVNHDANLPYKTCYRRSDSAKDSVFNCYTIKDLGEVVHDIFDSEYALNLDESHREDPILIEIVEELGKEASGRYGCLEVVEIPDELVGNYMIDDYDGIETLHQKVQEY